MTVVCIVHAVEVCTSSTSKQFIVGNGGLEEGGVLFLLEYRIADMSDWWGVGVR